MKLFVAEGIKTVSDLFHAGFSPHSVYCTDDRLPGELGLTATIISQGDLRRMSTLKTPNKILAVFEMPHHGPISLQDWVLVLDGIQDPGNLGTMIRLCDWYGIKDVVCSTETVDCFNPKVVQATMGSLARVAIHYTSLDSWLRKADTPIYGTSLEGSNIYETALPERGILVMGSESQGISESVYSCVQHSLTIPRFTGSKAESLNVAMATAVCLSELRRTALLTQK